jgi:3-oxoacyl-[acyl-carrier protein] reductase
LFENEKRLQDAYGLDRVLACKCDCTNVKSLKSLKNVVKDKWDCLDIVVVNVGDGRSVSDTLPDDEQWQKTWNSNFESALQTARIFLPMLEESKGCLLFISSITGVEAFGAPTDYSTAKSAIIALAKNMARKLAPDNVRVNVIAPGNVFFKGGSWDIKIEQDKKLVDEIIKSTVPMNRFATPKEIADSAVFFGVAKRFIGTVDLMISSTSFLSCSIFISQDPPLKNTLPGAITFTLTLSGANFLAMFFASAIIADLAVE